MLDEWEDHRWRVALMAHDAKQRDLVAFARRHQTHLANWYLIATKAVGEMLGGGVGLKISRVVADPGEDVMELAAEIATGEVDAIIFLRNPLTPQPADPDMAGLLRLADLCNVPLATNLASAECLLIALAPGGWRNRPIRRGQPYLLDPEAFDIEVSSGVIKRGRIDRGEILG